MAEFKNIYDSPEDIEVSFSVTDSSLFRLPFGRLFSVYDVWTGAGKTGTQLVDGVDYSTGGESENATAIKGETIYSGFQIINATYHSTTLYASITWVGNLRIENDVQPVREGYNIMDATNQAITLPDANNESVERFYKRTGAGSGVVTFATTSSQTINGYAASAWGLKGESDILLIPVDGNWEVKALHGFIYHVQDQKSSGTDGGTFTAGSQQTRDLNIELENSLYGATLSSNSIELLPGRYIISGSAPASDVGSHMASVYNNTAAATVIWGTSMFASTGGDVMTHSKFFGVIEITVTSIFYVKHEAQNTISTFGFGRDVGTVLTVDHETYTDVLIERIS